MHRVVCVSFVVTLIGMAFSLIAPHFFAVAAEVAGATHFGQEGRATGFFLQPNTLAISMGLLFIGWFALRKHKGILLEVGAIMGILVAMLLTGSRTGIFMAVIMGAFITLASWKRELANGRLLLRICMLILCLVVGIAAARGYLSQRESVDTRRSELISRMSTMLDFGLSDEGGLLQDGSLRERLDAQGVYWSLIKERPLFGHGLGAEVYYRERGVIAVTAHSSAISSAMEYGILYPIVYLLLLFRLYRGKGRREEERVLRTNSVGQFVVITMLLFVIASFTDPRAFYVVFGMLFASVCFPRYVWRYEAEAGSAKGPVSCREAVAESCLMQDDGDRSL